MKFRVAEPSQRQPVRRIREIKKTKVSVMSWIKQAYYRYKWYKQNRGD